jgi:hypothetical protein
VRRIANACCKNYSISLMGVCKLILSNVDKKFDNETGFESGTYVAFS